MAVNPYIREVEHVPKVTHEPCIHRIITVTRVHRPRRHAVVGDYYCATIERCYELFLEPGKGFFVLGQRVRWHEPLKWTGTDDGMVVHELPGHPHAELPIAI